MPILAAAVADVTAGRAAGRNSRQISGVSGSRQLLAALVLSGPGASSEAHERSDRMRAATAFAARFRRVNSRRRKTSRLSAMRPAFRKIATMRARSMKWRSGKMRCLTGYPRRPSKRNGLVNRNAARAFASRIIEELDVRSGISRYERTMSEGAASVEALCRIAADCGLPVDMNCGQSDDPMSRHIEILAAQTVRVGLQGRQGAATTCLRPRRASCTSLRASADSG